jgi:hypothetical protein
MSSRTAQLPTPDSPQPSRYSPRQLLKIPRLAGFWLAVALPLAYPPLLAGGLPDWQAPTFVALFTLNVLALMIGHNYGRD